MKTKTKTVRRNKVMDWTGVILGVLTLLGGCGWVIDRKKHRQEIESLKADIRQKNMDLGKMYVDEFHKNIVKPLEVRVEDLTNEVKSLKYAVQGINDCAHRSDCPVRGRMQRATPGGK